MIFYRLKFLRYVCCWKKRKDLLKMFEIGQKKVNQEFNVVKIV